MPCHWSGVGSTPVGLWAQACSSTTEPWGALLKSSHIPCKLSMSSVSGIRHVMHTRATVAVPQSNGIDAVTTVKQGDCHMHLATQMQKDLHRQSKLQGMSTSPSNITQAQAESTPNDACRHAPCNVLHLLKQHLFESDMHNTCTTMFCLTHASRSFHLKVQAPCAWLVVAVVPDLYAGERENLVVVGPGWGRNVDQLQRVVEC